MNDLENVKVGDTVVCFNTHWTPYIAFTTVVKRITPTLLICGDSDSLRIKIKDATRLGYSKYSSDHYYPSTHQVIVGFNLAKETKLQLEVLKGKVKAAMQNATCKDNLIKLLQDILEEEKKPVDGAKIS